MKKGALFFSILVLLVATTLLTGCIKASINIPPSPDEETPSEGQTLSSPGTDAPDGGTAQVPNPMVTYRSFTEMYDAVGYECPLPYYFPEGYTLYEIYVISEKVTGISFKKGDDLIDYRTSVADDNISGDFNVYAQKETLTVNDATVTIQGDNDSFSLAEWSKDGLNFSLTFTAPLSAPVIEEIISSIG